MSCISPGARRPDGKARRRSILGICDGGATPPAPGSRRGSRVGVEEGCPARELCESSRFQGTSSCLSFSSAVEFEPAHLHFPREGAAAPQVFRAVPIHCRGSTVGIRLAVAGPPQPGTLFLIGRCRA